MIKTYNICGYEVTTGSTLFDKYVSGKYVLYQDFQTLVQLMKEYIDCDKKVIYTSEEESAILNKIEQFLGKGWDK